MSKLIKELIKEWEKIKAEYSQSGLFDNVLEEEIDKDIQALLAKAINLTNKE